MPPSTEDRRQQIVLAAIDLLATRSVDQITTRALARAVGFSQPALFRHFHSRDAIVSAVVDHIHAELGQEAELILQRPGTALEHLTALVGAIAGYAVRTPGLPRLLFHGLARSETAPVALIADMQRALFGALLRAAQSEEDLPASLDVDQAASLLAAAVQGLMVQWALRGRQTPLEEQAAAMVGVMLSGFSREPPLLSPLAEPPGPSPALSQLDVRPMLAEGHDPFDTIDRACRAMPTTGLLQVIAPFRPGPLLAVLHSRGLRADVQSRPDGSWLVEILGPDAPAPLDLRDLEAPEPLERCLEATAALEPGSVVIARLPRLPRLLLAQLESRPVETLSLAVDDGTGLVWIRKMH